jgi:hypothetical protein
MTRRWPRGTCCASTAASSPPPGSATTTFPARQARTSSKPDDAGKPASAPASTRSTGASSNTATPAPIFAATAKAARSPWPSPTTRPGRRAPGHPGRRYDGAAKANAFPFPSLPAVVELADAHQIEVTAEVRALAKIPAERTEVPAVPPPVRLDTRNGTIIIDAPFNPDLTQALKDANHGRSTWDRNARVHRLTPRAATALPELALRFGLQISEQAREAITAETARQDQNRAGASAFEADPVPVPGLADGTALKAQQYPVVRFALAHRTVLIGDDMGWGKTLSSLAAAAAGAWPAVVVCRPSLTLNWAAEISRFFPALTIHQAAGTTPAPVPPGTDIIVIGSAALAAKSRTTPAWNHHPRTGGIPAALRTAPRPTNALICDEVRHAVSVSASLACPQTGAPDRP